MRDARIELSPPQHVPLGIPIKRAFSFLPFPSLLTTQRGLDGGEVIERFSLDCRKGLVLVSVLVLLRPLVG